MNKIIWFYGSLSRFLKAIFWMLAIGLLIICFGSIAEVYTFSVFTSIGVTLVAFGLAIYVIDLTISANMFPFNEGKNIFVSYGFNLLAYLLVWFFLLVGLACVTHTFAGKTIDVLQPYLSITAICSLIVLAIWPVVNYYKSLK